MFTRSFANHLIYPFDYYFINQLVFCFIASQVHWSFMVCSLIRLFFLFVHSLIRPFFYPSINFSHGFIHPPQIFFFCPKEPGESCGGETPLARCSDIVSKLDSEVVKKFEVKESCMHDICRTNHDQTTCPGSISFTLTTER